VLWWICKFVNKYLILSIKLAKKQKKNRLFDYQAVLAALIATIFVLIGVAIWQAAQTTADQL